MKRTEVVLIGLAVFLLGLHLGKVLKEESPKKKWHSYPYEHKPGVKYPDQWWG